MMGHRSKAASALQRRISNNLRRILLTEQEILLSTSSGTGLMEGAVRSCTAKRAAIFSVGAFGDKWYKIATGNGVPSDIFKSELGQPTTPEMVDAALSTGKYDTICITHNETSTGIQNPVEEIAEVLKKYPDVVWCMDAVSSAAGSRIETDKLGVDVTAYYATEIDKYAIQTTQHNFPDTVQLGDAFQVRDEEWRPRRAEEAE